MFAHTAAGEYLKHVVATLGGKENTFGGMFANKLSQPRPLSGIVD